MKEKKLKPCKEYGRLIGYISKYSGYPVCTEQFYSQAMGGKRGVLWDLYGEKMYADYTPQKCKYILSELRANRLSKDKMIVKRGIENYLDDFERQHSEYYEVECEGEHRVFLEITIKTPGGKVKYQTKLF